MGKRNQNKSKPRGKVVTEEQQNEPRKLPKQKRGELNALLEKILKVSTNVPVSSTIKAEWDAHFEIQKLLEKVTHIESGVTVLNSERNLYLNSFVQWLDENGADFKNISISQFPDYDYGLSSKNKITNGELILTVPRKLMITTDTVKESLLGPLMKKDVMLQHMPNVALSLMLLIEKFQIDSFWKPYIAMLPKQYNTVLYFKTEELQELKGSPTLEPALKQCRNIARQYAYLNKLFQITSDPASDLLRDVFTYEEYCWAVSTVMTRQNFVPSEDGSTMLHALIPLWDMANHTNGMLSTDYNTTLQRLECIATQNYEPGDQVFIFYGDRSNSEFFVHNGFVYPENIHDNFRLKLGVSKADTLFNNRSSLLSKLGLPISGDFFLKPGPDPVDGRLLAFLRIFNMGKEQLEHWLSNERACDLVYVDCALETDVEARTWSFLLARINLLLSAYSSTLQEDIELLENKSVTSPCHQLALQMRVSEKRILHGALKYVQQRVHS